MNGNRNKAATKLHYLITDILKKLQRRMFLGAAEMTCKSQGVPVIKKT